jgi:hypothetical protein
MDVDFQLHAASAFSSGEKPLREGADLLEKSKISLLFRDSNPGSFSP